MIHAADTQLPIFSTTTTLNMWKRVLLITFSTVLYPIYRQKIVILTTYQFLGRYVIILVKNLDQSAEKKEAVCLTGNIIL